MTEANQIPSFDFSGSDIADDATLDAQLEAETSSTRRFEPGKYEVEIDSVSVHGKGKNDDTWTTLAVELRGVGDRQITTYVLVPSRDFRYGPKKTLFPYKNLQGFCSALGVELKRENAEQVLKDVFGRLDGLKGGKLAIEVGHRKGYVKWIGKNSEGGNQYNLIAQDGNVVCSDSTKQPLVFSDFASAKAHADDNGIAIDNISVLKYGPAASGSGLKIGKVANW